MRRYPFEITYTISNGGTYAYLDAIRILKENSVPKVTYNITPNAINTSFLKTAYDKLGQIVMIND